MRLLILVVASTAAVAASMSPFGRSHAQSIDSCGDIHVEAEREVRGRTARSRLRARVHADQRRGRLRRRAARRVREARVQRQRERRV